MLKALFWCFTIVGLMGPVFLAALTWNSATALPEMDKEPRPATANAFTLIHTWEIRLWPLSMGYYPHVWAAAMILLGSVLVVLGIFSILHVPKIVPIHPPSPS